MNVLQFAAPPSTLALRSRSHLFPTRSRPRSIAARRPRPTLPLITAISTVDGDQFDQYHDRDENSLTAALGHARALPHRQRHTHIFLHESSFGAFRPAAMRFMKSARTAVAAKAASAASPHPDTPQETTQQQQQQQQQNQRLWLMRSVADPTFGELRGLEPAPPRSMLIQPLAPDRSESHPVERWVTALNRVEKLGPFDSYFVEWALCHICCADGAGDAVSPRIQPEWYAASETINANWGDAKTIPAMRDQLIEHAEDVVSAGYATSFEVLQSVKSPTCFKTMEVYKSIDDLESSMKTLDKAFDEAVQKNRAAVNRVRQLHQCWDCL